MSGGWQQRVGHAPGPHLLAAQNAARNLAEQAGSMFPGKGRLVFQTVTDVALLGTVLISGALAAVHLWRALAPKPKEQHSVEAAGGSRVPPRRPPVRTATVAEGNSGRSCEEDGARSR